MMTPGESAPAWRSYDALCVNARTSSASPPGQLGVQDDQPFRVARTSSLDEALLQLQSESFDAVNVLTGPQPALAREAIAALRAAAPEAALVALVECESIELTRAALDAGADDVLAEQEAPELWCSRTILRAIEHRRQLQRAMRRDAMWERLVGAMAEAVITVDDRHKIQSFNHAAERLFGYPAAEIVGADLGALLPPAQRGTHPARFNSYAQSGASHLELRREVTGQHRDGGEFPAEIRVTEMLSPEGFRCFCCLVRDLTDQRTREEEIRRLSCNLQSRNEELTRALQEAQAATRAKSEFLANMSHELRTPLTAILGFAETLLDDQANDASPERVEAVRTILNNGEHLTRIINDLLDLSKIEANAASIDVEECAPLVVTQEVTQLMSLRAQGKRIRLNVPYHGEFPECALTDSARLRQILVNLLGNAIKFTDVGEVAIAVSAQRGDGNEALLRWDVIDTGIGMDAAECERIFHPFTQANTSTSRRFGGTGLGLAVSKRFASMLGGDIQVESTPGRGSCFSLLLPVVCPPSTRWVAPAEPRPAATRSTARSEAPPLECRVLLAEDGPDNRRLISFVLQKRGAEVTTAENGAEAVARVQEAEAAGKPFDVILMDMQMPVVDGYEATRRLRAEGYERPIIALTAHAMQGDRDKCLAAGCDSYATKPIDRERLLALVETYAGQRQVEA